MTVGENLNEVEKLIVEYAGCKYAVVLFCETSFLHLTLKLMSDSMDILNLIAEHYRDIRCSAQI